MTINCNQFEHKIQALTQEEEFRLHKIQENLANNESFFNNTINNLKMQVEELKGSKLFLRIHRK